MEILICLSILVLTQFDAGVGGEYCKIMPQSCTFGCCGVGINEYCCPYTGPIIGICIGLTVLAALFVLVMWCCKRQASAGRVLSQQTAGYGVNTGGVGYQQQPVVYQQESGQQAYVYPTAQAGYTPVPPGPPSAQMGHPYPQHTAQAGYTPVPTDPPSAEMGYPYAQQTKPVSQKGYQQHPSPAQPSYGYSPQQMPVSPSNRPIDMQTIQGQPQIEPSAPPPSYEEVLKVPQ